MRQIITSLPGIGLLQRLKHRLVSTRASAGYRSINLSEVTPQMADGWKSEAIPDKQRQIVNAELAQMRAGHVPKQFAVAAEAVRQTGCIAPDVLEIGCASGFYSEVLGYLLDRKLRYTGLDYSMPLVKLAHKIYPSVPFLNGDATRLPFDDATWDVVISGCVILHILDWQKAVTETTRVAKEWCVFHRTPICDGPTTLTSKQAYGVKVPEWHFNESDLLNLIRTSRFDLVSTLPIAIGGTAEGIAGEMSSITYLFHKVV